jgi:hypothetical protein
MKDLVVVRNPAEFFFQTVKLSAKAKNISLSEDSEFYLVSMLSRLSRTDALFSTDQNGSFKREPLVFMLKEAEEEIVPSNKKVLFQHIGDISLHTVGVFPERSVSDAYYCTLGKMAYSQTAKLQTLHTMKNLYRELAMDFEKFVAVLKGIPLCSRSR